ncbi:hypothetical protein [Sphingobium olei]|uniref:Uncharacterized protein n=1 Tax=Sphingobium olei TaxID=420955 RepID=A0ABW3NTR3_9SPHN
MKAGDELDASTLEFGHIAMKNLSRKLHVMLQKQHGEEKMRCGEAKAMRAAHMVVDAGLGAARLDFPEPAHAHPHKRGQFFLRHALEFAPFLDTAPRDQLHLGKNEDTVMRRPALR